MNRFITVIISIGCAIFGAYAVFAFTEPTGTPPLNNAPAPLTVGSGRQVKGGDLTVMNMKASSITLGEDTRTTWLEAGSACAWEGWKCGCQSDGSSGASLALTIGTECKSGRLTDMKIVSMAISSKGKSCGAAAPPPCTPSLYKYQNAGGSQGSTFLDDVSCLWGLFC